MQSPSFEEAQSKSNTADARPHKEKKEKKHKKKDKKSRDKKAKAEGQEPSKEVPLSKRAQSFAVPVESAIPLSHALLEHFINKLDPSLRDAEVTLRRIREHLGVHEDDSLDALLGSLSLQDAFTARLEILKSKLQTTEAIVQVAVQENTERRLTTSEAEHPHLEPLAAATPSPQASSATLNGAGKKSDIYCVMPSITQKPKDASSSSEQPEAYSNKQQISLPTTTPAASSSSSSQGDPRKISHHQSSAATSSPSVIPAHLVKPSEVAAGKGAGKYTARSLSRRTAQLYAQYGDHVDQAM